MNRPRRRHLPARIEALEARALLAVAGSLDPGFGGGYGAATAPLDVPVVSSFAAGITPETEVGLGATPTSVTALPDGNILVTATVSNTTLPLTTVAALFVEELDADGSVDTSFGTDGRVEVPIHVVQATGTDSSTASIQAFRVAVEPGGQILLASTLAQGAGNSTYMVARLNADGTPDATFGVGGVAEYPAGTTTPAADRIDQLAAALPRADGEIDLVGSSAAGFSAVQLNPDGSLDKTYGSGGTATIPVTVNSLTHDVATSAALQPDGRVVLTGTVATGPYLQQGVFNGTYFTDVAAVRLNTNGSLDMTYGGSASAGHVLIPPDLAHPSSLGFNQPDALAIQPTTGDVVIAGFDAIGTEAPVVTHDTLYRLNADGTLDGTFGTGGLATFSSAGSVTPGGLAIQANGDILATAGVGYLIPFGPVAEKLELLRFNADGTPDAGFGSPSTPGTLLTNLTLPGPSGGGSLPTPSATPSPTIQATTGDIFLAGLGTVPSPARLTYGVAVDAVLASATTGPAARPAPPPPPASLTGQGYSNVAAYDPATGSFEYVPSDLPPDATTFPLAFGVAGIGQTIPAVADYQGLGFDQIAAYLTASGVYAVLPTTTSAGLLLPFGIPGEGNTLPVPADYEGTGKADVAVYLPSLADFAILPAPGSPARVVHFGAAGVGQSIPAPADYYGTGRADIAVYLPSIGAFAVQDPSGKTPGEVVSLGLPVLGDSEPAPGDYDGSGRVEFAVYESSVGAFFYLPAKGGPAVEVKLGTANAGELPVPGDYDGSGRTEAAVYDTLAGTIRYLPAGGGPAVTIRVGKPGDDTVPVVEAGVLAKFAAVFAEPGLAARPAVAVPAAGASSPPSPAVAPVKVSAAAGPSGPMVASARVARLPVNQAAPDPLKVS